MTSLDGPHWKIKMTDFKNWLIIDRGYAASNSWVAPGFERQRLLVLTPKRHQWFAEPIAEVPISEVRAPGEACIVVITKHKDPLNEVEFSGIERLLGFTGVGALQGTPVWCHYGGDIAGANLQDEWSEFEYVTPLVRGKISALLPRPLDFPLPCSTRVQLPWREDWERLRQLIREDSKRHWNEMMSILSNSWSMATKSYVGEDLEAVLRRWHPFCKAIGEIRDALASRGQSPDSPTLDEIRSMVQVKRPGNLFSIASATDSLGPLERRLHELGRATRDRVAILIEPAEEAARRNHLSEFTKVATDLLEIFRELVTTRESEAQER